MSYRIKIGDCIDVLRTLKDACIDSIVTDPPYELGFMGKRWDASGIAYSIDLWRETLRVLKPGGHLVAFGGTRTCHRMACAIEDAGFEIRDSLDWLYGQGFPKSLDVSKAIDAAAGAEREVIGPATRHGGGDSKIMVGDYSPPRTAPVTPEAQRWQGFGTALKPAHEPIVLARKPLGMTVAECVLAHGCGGLNVDATRIAFASDDDKAAAAKSAAEQRAYQDQNAGRTVLGRFENGPASLAPYLAGMDKGRWPPNVLLTHAPDCTDECAPGCPIAALDAQSEGVARFFPAFTWDDHDFDLFRYVAKASTRDRGGRWNTHPTVKPVALMRWLCRLVTPPGGIIVDPFLGSGTTAVAAIREGFNVLGIEREAEYVEIAEARIKSIVS